MYIRTKDGAIYDLKSREISSIEQKDCCVNIFYYDREKGQYLEWDDNGGRSMDTIYKTEILNQSENLEELCDEFVLIEHYSDQEDKYHHRDKKSFIEDYIGYEHIDIVLNYYTIYGAIWTSKGLIYVAKMNSDGKLVLI